MAVRMQDRHRLGPVLVLGIDFENLGTGTSLQTSPKASIRLSRDRIEQHLIGERELILRIPAADVLAVGSCWLGETIVHEDTAGAADPVQHSIEDTTAVFI